MYKKLVKAIANGVIRTITVVNIRGANFYLLPKRGIWSKGNNNTRRSSTNGKESNAR